MVSALVGAGGNLGAVILGSMHSCKGTDWGPSDEAADSERLIMLLSSQMRPSLSFKKIGCPSLPCRISQKYTNQDDNI